MCQHERPVLMKFGFESNESNGWMRRADEKQRCCDSLNTSSFVIKTVGTVYLGLYACCNLDGFIVSSFD